MAIKKSKGNMYDWISHTHSHLRGKCSHECGYCYVQSMASRFDEVKEKYSGKVELIEEELKVDYGDGKLIFVEHMNDLFAKEIPDHFIERILSHTVEYPKSNYVLQTKNPSRYIEWLELIRPDTILGTTIESNRVYGIMGKAPTPFNRLVGIHDAMEAGQKTFITIEPILNFDLDEFVEMLVWAKPSFVNIGADSKGHGLDEPEYDKIMSLYEKLIESNIEVRKKINLERLRDKVV